MKWTTGIPTSSELVSNYAFNGGLTGTLWYAGGGKPGNVNGTYQWPITPWRISRMDPKWPILADLREAGQWGYGGSVVSANHDAEGYTVLSADGSVRWLALRSTPSLVGVVLDYTSNATTHSPLANVWVRFITMR